MHLVYTSVWVWLPSQFMRSFNFQFNYSAQIGRMQCKRRSTLSVTQISCYIKGASSSIVLIDLWDNNSLLARTSVGRFFGSSLASSWGGRPWHLHFHRSLGQARKWLGAWPSVGWLRSDVEQGAVVLPLNDIKSPGKAEAAPVLPAYCPANSAAGSKGKLYHAHGLSHSSFSRVQGCSASNIQQNLGVHISCGELTW